MAPPEHRSETPPQARRLWARPRLKTVHVNGQPQVLLCTSNAPYVCEGGGCCDIAPDCRYYCNGG